MSILKKLTRKYKFLRFFNYKTTKLAILSAALFGLCLSSGASFAKYRDENYGNGNAGVAQLGTGILSYDYEMNQTPSSLNVLTDSIYYAFMASFRIEFFESEVSRDFSLHLKMSKTPNADYKEYDPSLYSSFLLPNNEGNKTMPTFITKIVDNVGTAYKVPTVLPVPDEASGVDISSEEDTNRTKWDEFYYDNNKMSVFKSDTLYFAIASDEDVDSINGTTSIDYTWKSYNVGTNKESVTTILEKFVKNSKLLDGTELILGLEPKTYYFRLVFFSKLFINSDGDLDKESTKILFNFEINQI